MVDVFRKLLICWDLRPQTVSRVCRERSEKERIPSEQQVSGPDRFQVTERQQQLGLEIHRLTSSC